MTKKTLNLGCGNKIYPDAVNHDIIKHRDEVDVVHDLDDMPWPWPDNRFEHIIAYSVLEHLDRDLLAAMNELWRIMKPGGQLDIKLPYWNHERTYNDPTHRRGYGRGIFDQFDPQTKRGKEYAFYTPCKWKIVKRAFLNPQKSSVLALLKKIPKETNG